MSPGRVSASILLLAAVGQWMAPEAAALRPRHRCHWSVRDAAPIRVWARRGDEDGIPSVPLRPPCVKKDGYLGPILFSSALCRRCGPAAAKVWPRARPGGCVEHALTDCDGDARLGRAAPLPPPAARPRAASSPLSSLFCRARWACGRFSSPRAWRTMRARPRRRSSLGLTPTCCRRCGCSPAPPFPRTARRYGRSAARPCRRRR